MKKDFSERLGNGVKNVLTRLIKNVSIIAIFLVLIIVIFTSLGAEFSLGAFFTSSLGVESVLLSIGTVVLYELWLRNGETNGRAEKDYQDCIELFQSKSKNISPERMQMFIEAEKQRRYKVEEKRIMKELENVNKQLEKKTLSKAARKFLEKKKQRLEDHVIVVDMPYKVSEEIEGLRFAVKDNNKREYKPSATRRYLAGRRVKKYATTIFFAMFSVNVIVMGAINGRWLDTVLALIVAVVCITMAVVGGFTSGYRAITITSFGVYQTANEFIDKAVSWCTKNGFSLYYAEDEEEKSFKKTEELIPYLVDEPDDYYRPTIEEVFGRPEVIIE